MYCFPVTIGGSLESDKYFVVGTEHKVYIEDGGQLNDITPITSTTGTLNNIFNTTSGSNTIVVSINNHNIEDKSFVKVSSFGLTIGGNITLSGDYQTSLISIDAFAIDASITAAATSSSTGSAVFKYRYESGVSVNTGGYGYGAGNYGGLDAGVAVRAWNVPSTITNINIQLRDWSFSTFGEDLLINAYPQGRIYRWNENTGSGVEASVLAASPTVTNGVLVSTCRS